MNSSKELTPIEALQRALPHQKLTLTLNFLNMPEDMRGGKWVGARIGSGLPIFGELASAILGDYVNEVSQDLAAIANLATQTTSALKLIELQSVPAVRVGRSERGNIMMHHDIGRHPLYGVFCCIHADPAADKILHALQTLLFLAQANLQLQAYGESELRMQPFMPLLRDAKNAGRALRRLSMANNVATLLDVPISGTIDEIRKFMSKSSTKTLALSSVAYFLKRAFGNREEMFRTRAALGITHKGSSSPRELADGSVPPGDYLVDLYLRPEKQDKSSTESASDPTFLSTRNSGDLFAGPKTPRNAPEKIEFGEFILVESREEYLRNQRASIRGASDRQILDAQFLPFSWDSLTDAEAANVFDRSCEILQSVLSPGSGAELKHKLSGAASIIALAMMLTGSDYGRACGLRSCLSTSDFGLPGKLQLLRTDNSTFAWMLPAWHPKHQPYPANHSAALFPDAAAIALPLTSELGLLIERGLQQFGDVLANLPHRIFVKWLHHEVDKTKRITPNMLQNLLFDRASRACQDVAAGALFTSRGEIGQGARAHYTSLSVQSIWRMYSRAMSHLFSTLTQNALPPNPPAVLQTSLEARAGAPFQIRPSAAAHCLELHRQIDLSRPKTIEEARLRHNIFVSYCLLGFAIAIAARPRDNPLEHCFFDTDYSVVTIDDKAAPDSASRRIVGIPPIISQQLRLLIEHCLRFRVTVAARIDCPHGVYLLGDGHVPVPITLGTRQAIVDTVHPIPIDGIRRLVRSELVVASVGGQIIDCILGHWHFGQEPHRCTSTLSFQSARAEMARATGRLLQFLGFVPLRSWLND